jgi:hypothetical protein
LRDTADLWSDIDLSLGELLLCAVVLAALGGLVAFLVHGFLVVPGRTRNAWSGFAARVGTLKLEQGSLGWTRLVGEYRGRSVEAGIGSARSAPRLVLTFVYARYVTVVSTGCSSLLPSFALYPQGILPELMLAACGRDVRIGDPVFDGALRTAGTNEAEVRALLWDPSLRRTLLEHARTLSSLTVSEGRLWLQKDRLVTQHAELQAMFEAIILVAQALDLAMNRGAARHAQDA